jgi:hypothetical protein
MSALDHVITRAMPGASRRLWAGTFWGGSEQEIVGYGDLVQHRPRGEPVEWFVLGLARQRRHLSVYVNAVEDGRYLIQRYAPRLGRVKVGSASAAFRSVADLDLDVLRELAVHAHRLTATDPGA